MIYQVLVHSIKHIFAGAHPKGDEWGRLEAAYIAGEWQAIAPFEMVETDDLEPADEDFDVILSCSFGDLVVRAHTLHHTLEAT